MPYILIVVGPSTTENRYLARLGFDDRGASQVAIHSYEFTGIAGPGPAFVEFQNQPTTPINGDIFSSCFPLFKNEFFAGDQNFFHQYNPPLLITEGDNQWNGSHQLIISLFDANHNPLIFTQLVMLLSYIPVDPHDPERRVNELKRTTVSEPTSRNYYPLPRTFEQPWLNTELKTSYPYRP